ncbi:unnamed protein product [Sphagnum jensenii]|uniref:Roadblock/LAMTOR2 domain-containing protein n=1 Tax=Sphagnum jensenii TaxID=128206 RepID=A0ABP1BGS2_9BRYO
MAEDQEPKEGELDSSASKEGVPKLVNRRESEIGRDKRASANRAEAEETIKRIASHRGIIGTVITNNDAIPIRSSMDKEGTQQYAAFVTPLAQRAKMITLNHDQKNELTMLRIRTTTTEMIVTPEKEYYLIAVQKTSHAPDPA